MYNGIFPSETIFPYKNRIFFEKDLIIETYIVGYKSEGEAILIFVRSDGGISFSGLVDCFCLKEINKVSEILEENKVNKLNFICWTHPDFDHSKGLKEIIDKYVSVETSIWIPEGVDSKEITCSKEVQDLFEYLKKCVINMDAEYNVYSVSDKKDMMYYNSFCFQKNTDIYPLRITSYAPNSKIIRKQDYIETFIKNDRSIFFVFALGEVRIFLTGDIEDDTIEKMPRDCWGEHVHILKIPHHGSGSSIKMLDLNWNDCDIACTTVYRRGKTNLPLPDVMKKYNERTQYLLCTGKVDGSKESEDYGVIKIETDVLEHTFNTSMEGNAERWLG